MSQSTEYDPYDPIDVARANTAQDERAAEATNEVVSYLYARQEAYRRLFAGTPAVGDADIVKRDLEAFCRGNDSAFNADDRVHALLTGRQEVYLRIQDHLRLSRDELLVKYTTPPTKD